MRGNYQWPVDAPHKCRAALRASPWHDVIILKFALQLPIAYGQMKASAQGTGYAMLQMEYNQNTEKEWLVSGPSFESYHIEKDSVNFTGRNYSHMDARFCIK